MTTAHLSTIDLRVREAIVRQLDGDPQVDATAIGVAVKDGAVTLTGFIDTYAGKLAAERAAKHVQGIRAVANDIEVTPMIERTDADIAADVVTVLRITDTIPTDVQAAVHRGHISLTGKAQWPFQRRAAETAVRHLRGVRGVANYITLDPEAALHDIRRHIVTALHRNATIDSRHINVEAVGTTVTLSGYVGSRHQRDAAEWAAVNTPGVVEVVNQLAVKHSPAPGENEIV
jgi:osmotically-inducible protein OsmY